jgi:hypothetical protein
MAYILGPYRSVIEPRGAAIKYTPKMPLRVSAISSMLDLVYQPEGLVYSLESVEHL